MPTYIDIIENWPLIPVQLTSAPGSLSVRQLASHEPANFEWQLKVVMQRFEMSHLVVRTTYIHGLTCQYILATTVSPGSTCNHLDEHTQSELCWRTDIVNRIHSRSSWIRCNRSSCSFACTYACKTPDQARRLETQSCLQPKSTRLVCSLHTEYCLLVISPAAPTETATQFVGLDKLSNWR